MQDVTLDRNLYIGGSDIPIIMGISPFKKRFDLLLEKAGVKDNEFKGNEYTEYGNVLEPKIRDYCNQNQKNSFWEDKKIIGDIRCHVDGFNGEEILEIKTTSQIHYNLEDYKVYLVQILFYMHIYNVEDGQLLVYERPNNFNDEFEEKRLQIWFVRINEHKELLEQILKAVDQFRIDLARVKENPFITEEELQPKELIELSNKVVELENQLAAFKDLEKQHKEMKQQLFEAMELYNVKKWTTNNGVQITKIDSKPDTSTTSKVFNVDKFKEENLELYNNYVEEKTITKKGTSGYLKITLPKVK